MLRGVTLGLCCVLILAVTARVGGVPPEKTDPRGDPTAGATYVGEKACKKCHFGQHRTWKKMKHAQAWSGLEKYLAAEHGGVDRKDAEGRRCVSCHVTGYGQEARGGFKSVAESPHLLGVQCESCHGPGSKHVEAGNKVRTEKRKLFAEGENSYTVLRTTKCANCHNPHKSHENLK